MQYYVFCVLVCFMIVGMSSAQGDPNCAHIFATNLNVEDKQVLCNLYRRSAILSQLSMATANSMDQFIGKQLAEAEPRFEKRKHEYLRFGRK